MAKNMAKNNSKQINILNTTEHPWSITLISTMPKRIIPISHMSIIWRFQIVKAHNIIYNPIRIYKKLKLKKYLQIHRYEYIK